MTRRIAIWTLAYIALPLLLGLCMALLGAAPSQHTTHVLPVPNRPAKLVAAHVLPDPKLTPGAVYSDVTGEQATTRGYAQGVRNVPESVKKQVFAEYGIKNPKPGEYEVDHLASLQLSGSNDIRNLWPEPMHLNVGGFDLGARTKDALEDHLAALVRAKKITIQEAVSAITVNWVDAYKKFIGPLPKYR